MKPNALAAKKVEHPPLAVVMSESQGRLRLMLRSKKRDKPYFNGLLHALGSLPGVSKAEANPVTGSLLIYSTLSKDDLIALVEKNGLLTISSGHEGRPMPVERHKALHPRPQAAVGTPELSALAGMTLLSLAALQGARGKFLPAGLTLIFQATEFLKSWHLRPTTSHYEPLSEGL